MAPASGAIPFPSGVHRLNRGHGNVPSLQRMKGRKGIIMSEERKAQVDPVQETDPETGESRAEPAPETDPETGESRAEPASETDRRAKKKQRRIRALRDLLIRTALFCLVVYILFFHLVGITVMPNGDMSPRMDAGDLLLFYRLEQNIRGQDVIVFRKPTASLERSYAENTAQETAPLREKNFLRKALDWLGFRDPADPPMTTFVCRVVAGPGDTVEISDGERLIVNGNAMIEPNIFYSTPEYEGFVRYPLTLGEDEFFVLADYRNGGADSRFFGAVRRDEILGTVITVLRRNNL